MLQYNTSVLLTSPSNSVHELRYEMTGICGSSVDITPRHEQSGLTASEIDKHPIHQGDGQNEKGPFHPLQHVYIRRIDISDGDHKHRKRSKGS